MSDERINSITTTTYSITSELRYYGCKSREEFNGSYLKQDQTTFNHVKILNIYIVHEISKNINISIYSTLKNCLFGDVSLTYPTVKNCLFGAVSLTKDSNIDHYKYSGHGIRFYRNGSFSFLGIGSHKKVIIFGLDMSSSSNIDNKKKDILILDKGPTQGIEHALTAEKFHSITFTENNKMFCLSLHYNGANSYLLMVQKLLNWKQKILIL